MGQYAGDSVFFASGAAADAHGDFALKHSDHFRYALAAVEHPKEDLGRDVVRIIPDQRERSLSQLDRLLPAKQVRVVESGAELRKLALQHRNALTVQFHRVQHQGALQQVLGQHAGSGAYFKGLAALGEGQRFGGALGGAYIPQEVLAQLFFSADFGHYAVGLSSPARRSSASGWGWRPRNAT